MHASAVAASIRRYRKHQHCFFQFRRNRHRSTHLPGRAARAGRTARRVRPPARLHSGVDWVDSLAGQNQSVPSQDRVEVAPIGAAAGARRRRPTTVVDVIGELFVSTRTITSLTSPYHQMLWTLHTSTKLLENGTLQSAVSSTSNIHH